MIPSSFIDEILARTDIVDVIEARVTLKKTGQNYSGLCPFHQEKSPSFSVSQEKQFYYCFGCQASGSAIKFLMEFDRMDFVTAIETLAGRLGMDVPNEQSTDDRASSRKRKQTLDVLTEAKDFYKQQLRSHPQRQRAVDYLKNRGLTGQIANRFEIGFAPPGWQNLLALFSEDLTQIQPWVDAGLMIENLDEDKRYDRFRDRIVFPIRDLRGRTIGFGGRVIGDGKPKYLNSPETTVFHKGRELYGLYEARRSQQKSARLLVVEGYMDVVALAQHGIEYAVATLGTSTSDDHIQRMYRQVSEIVFCFDGDGAGLRAAWKAMLGVLPHLSDGRSARFMFLPEGDDPDSLVRREGTEAFTARIDAADDVSTWFFEKLGQDLQVDGLDPETIAGRAALSKTAMPLLNLMPEGVLRQLMIDALAELTGLARGRLEDVTVKYQVP
ncbi:MAG: DNA primase, partial [Pseudomonadales bacterium]|nr:DNA primase [Pseudomonadales bacterium]